MGNSFELNCTEFKFFSGEKFEQCIRKEGNKAQLGQPEQDRMIAYLLKLSGQIYNGAQLSSGFYELNRKQNYPVLDYDYNYGRNVEAQTIHNCSEQRILNPLPRVLYFEEISSKYK